MVLSKDELLNGSKNITEFRPKNYDDVIFLRPLTIGEINSLEEMKSKALGTYVANETASTSKKKRVKGKMTAQAKVSVEKTTIADNKAQIKAVMWSLDNDSMPYQLTEEEVNSMDEPLFKEIIAKVKEISHWEDEDLEDDVEDFHQDE